MFIHSSSSSTVTWSEYWSDPLPSNRPPGLTIARRNDSFQHAVTKSGVLFEVISSMEQILQQLELRCPVAMGKKKNGHPLWLVKFKGVGTLPQKKVQKKDGIRWDATSARHFVPSLPEIQQACWTNKWHWWLPFGFPLVAFSRNPRNNVPTFSANGNTVGAPALVLDSKGHPNTGPILLPGSKSPFQVGR